MPDAQSLPGGAEDRLVMGAAAGQPQAVQAHAAHIPAPRFRQMMHSGFIAPEIRAARRPHRLRHRQRKPGRRVYFQLVVGFHHIRIVKKSRRRLGQLFQHHGAQGKVGRNDDADIMLPAHRIQNLQLVGVQPAGPQHHMHAPLGGQGRGFHTGIGVGELHHYLRAHLVQQPGQVGAQRHLAGGGGQRSAARGVAGAANQQQVAGRRNGAHRFGAHTPGGPMHHHRNGAAVP